MVIFSLLLAALALLVALFYFFRYQKIKNQLSKLFVMEYAMNHAQNPLYFVDPKSAAIFYVNKAACKTLGYTYEELTSLTIFNIDPNVTHEAWLKHNEHLKMAQTSDFLTQHKRKDGTLFEVEVFGNVFEYEGKFFNIAFAVDVTQKNHYQKALQESHDALTLRNQELEELAMLDALTKIPNRRFLDEIYAKRFDEHRREDVSLALLMIDVDDFKTYNDFYGHAKGDEVLIQIAQTLQKTLKRPTDFIARYGGEEFVVVLKETSLSGAVTMASELLYAIKFLQIPHEKSKILPYITTSIGIAWKDFDSQITQEELLSFADRALYKAKERGKNGYVLCEEVV
ncbi:diguanylate cyclase [Sulfurimonas sp.]|uniref:sensor domain-containing diguanylate cyclase n=1 Tax=Sulfurimonas sp. TaxID=2022749 RepID=UPI003D0F4532